jgi:hypothetical protein
VAGFHYFVIKWAYWFDDAIGFEGHHGDRWTPWDMLEKLGDALLAKVDENGSQCCRILFGDRSIELQELNLGPEDTSTRQHVISATKEALNKALIKSISPVHLYHGCSRVMFQQFKRAGPYLNTYDGIRHDFGINKAFYIDTDLSIAISWCVRKSDASKGKLSGNVLIFGMLNEKQYDGACSTIHLSSKFDVNHATVPSIGQSTWGKTIEYCRADDCEALVKPSWLETHDILVGKMAQEYDTRDPTIVVPVDDTAWGIHGFNADQLMLRTDTAMVWFKDRVEAALAVNIDVHNRSEKRYWMSITASMRSAP